MTGADGRIGRAAALYQQALFTGRADALAEAGRELDAVEADLALARGRILHAGFLSQRERDPDQAREDPRELELFERARELYDRLGDQRGRAEALFWVGCCLQVIRRDHDAAVPLLEQSLALATQAGDPDVMAEALRHLGIADHAAGRLEAARERLAESARLRRENGRWLGVASNLVGLIYVAAAQGRDGDARALLAEATAIAEARGATVLLAQLTQAGAALAAGGAA